MLFSIEQGIFIVSNICIKEAHLMKRKMTKKVLLAFREFLYEEEKSQATINKYMCDLKKLMMFMGEQEITKSRMIEYKEYLRENKQYKTSSINSFLVAANRLFEYLGWHDLRVKTYKIQQKVFLPENKDISKEEYKRLVRTAKSLGKHRTAMILQTICATGIRVSELSAITVSGVKRGMVEICCKGKIRQILIPRSLQVKLLHFIRKNGVRRGTVFCTKNGNAIDRTSIWREMKKLCGQARVKEDKVFPHNLRHLFAKSFYEINKDIAKLADVLGHSNIETTRIYIKSSFVEHRKQLELMDLILR